MKNIHKINDNIYITSDEDIKERDWFIENNKLGKCTNELWAKRGASILTKKIILTTDPDLIKDGVESIDDTFLEWFVKNPSCESVDVNYELGSCLNCEWNYDSCPNSEECLKSKYNIIIPKEEPKDVVLGYKTSLDAQMLDSQLPQTTSDKWKEYQDWLNEPPEISDEEITKLANEHILYNDSKRQWVIEGMKLYREHLKNK
jgi:hypothetical protein